MWLDGLVLLAIVLLAWLGARAGAAASGLRLASLPLAYAAGLAGAWAFGPALAHELEWSETAGGVVSGTVALFGAQSVLSLLIRVLRRREESPGSTSQALGAVFGALRGALYALPFLWLAGLAEGAREAGVAPDVLPDLSSAQLPAVGSQLIGLAARGVVDTKAPSGRIGLQLASHPAETVTSLQQVLRDPKVTSLQRDPSFWEAVEDGAVSAALARPAARALIADRSLRSRLAAIGAISPDAGREASVFQVELALALAELGPKLEAVRNDPALKSLLEDPAVRASVQNGDTLSLLGDPRFRSIVSQATR